MAPDTRCFTGLFGIPRNTFQSKWDILFDKDSKEWIAFKPAVGLYVYPCYSCRHMFYSKKSFLDHINRRAVVLQYKCSECCNELMTFYNRCSFLLHCRKHYGLDKGQINLANLEVSSLPFGLAGFFRHPDIPYLFDVEEEQTENGFMNSQFYTPKIEDKGKQAISMVPTHVIVNRSQNGGTQALALKQIAKNIPKCQFITLQAMKELEVQMLEANKDSSPVEIKREPDDTYNEEITFSEEPVTFQVAASERQPRKDLSIDQTIPLQDRPAITSFVEADDLMMPVIMKIETVDEPLRPTTSTPIRNMTGSTALPPLHSLLNKCSECQVQFPESLSRHFLGGNKPENERLRCATCKLICPTRCSFKAHARVHEKVPPFVCPDCGESFPDINALMAHMDEICFHMAKSVRFRCPGRRCGKIFASDATFGPHFRQLHIDTVYMCSACRAVFGRLDQCEEHCLSHDGDSGNIQKLFSCFTCGEENMNWQRLKKHIDFHCKDLSRCIYIFMCKFCKCYFRSVQTMATHLLNCKVQKTGIPRRVRSSNSSNFIHSKYISGQCKLCGNKIICLKAKPSVYCSKCLTHPLKSPVIVKTVKKPTVASPERCVCILCKVQIDFDERRQHQQECRYAKPQVLVEKLDLEKVMESTNQLNQSFSSSNSEFDGSPDGSPQKNRGDSSDENRPRKRHRPSKFKKAEVENDLTAEGPILFDGTYQCRICDYKNTLRENFHEHVKIHRNISTAYQCMECGECFVVKPPLVKHLLHFHNISNAEEYFMENDCFDKSAVTELAKVVKAPYLANNVKENQCKVCMEQFDDAEAHDKHFRIHGMAFLMRNSI